MAPRPPVTMNRIPTGPPGVMVSPLILQAQIVAPPGGGAMGLADTTRLENPFQAPMWLDEVRIRLPSPTGRQVQGDPNPAVGWANLSIELKMGNTSITHGHVPISLLGKVLTDHNFDEGNTGTNYEVTWKLPKPLFIPARELLRPTIYFQPYSGAPTRTVTILYACRPLAKNTPTPKNLQVPWVSFFMPPQMNVQTSPVDRTDQSSPADIYNPYDEELHVQRFMGRFMIQNSAEDIQSNMGLASAQVDLTTGLINVGTLVSAQDSMNNILVRDPTPFAHLFNYLDRAWTVNCRLPPKGFYMFTIDRQWGNYNTSGNALIATVGISMVGWREVRYYP